MNGDFTGLMYSFSGQTEVKIELLVNIQLLEKNEKRVVFFGNTMVMFRLAGFVKIIAIFVYLQ